MKSNLELESPAEAKEATQYNPNLASTTCTKEPDLKPEPPYPALEMWETDELCLGILWKYKPFHNDNISLYVVGLALGQCDSEDSLSRYFREEYPSTVTDVLN